MRFCLFQVTEKQNPVFSYYMFSVTCAVKMILWIRFLLVYQKLCQGPNKHYACLPQCKAAFWYSSKMLFYWLKIFRHRKTCDRLCFLYSYNSRRVRCTLVHRHLSESFGHCICCCTCKITDILFILSQGCEALFK